MTLQCCCDGLRLCISYNRTDIGSPTAHLSGQRSIRVTYTPSFCSPFQCLCVCGCKLPLLLWPASTEPVMSCSTQTLFISVRTVCGFCSFCRFNGARFVPVLSGSVPMRSAIVFRYFLSVTFRRFQRLFRLPNACDKQDVGRL